MLWLAISLLAIQGILLFIFCFFAFFNYLYGIASLWKPKIRRVCPSGRRIAVVVVAFNEKYVVEDTIQACEALTYENKLIVLADDSTVPEVIDKHRRLALSRGCKQVTNSSFVQEVYDDTGQLKRVPQVPIEIWESPHFVLIHRAINVGFKGGSLHTVSQYLMQHQVELMYLLDADWHPQEDALEKTVAVLEAYDDVAFIQTKRISLRQGMNLFQKYVAIHEEGCYYADFEGRQVLGHPILFSGCCTLFRLNAVTQVGSFTSGHLTEDLDLTNRLWLAGWRGIYLGNVINHGEVPFTFDHFRRQQERWAAGSARALREFYWPLLTTRKLGWFAKFSALRQNAYFTSTIFTAGAILLGNVTLLWLILHGNTYPAEYYLYILECFKTPILLLVYWCILANFVEPLVMIFIKKRSYREFLHFPMSFWYTWGNLHAYIIGNIKGLTGCKLEWFLTPKFARSRVQHLSRVPTPIRLLNLSTCMIFLGFYFSEGWLFGWFDEFALLWIPAFLLTAKE